MPFNAWTALLEPLQTGRSADVGLLSRTAKGFELFDETSVRVSMRHCCNVLPKSVWPYIPEMRPADKPKGPCSTMLEMQHVTVISMKCEDAA